MNYNINQTRRVTIRRHPERGSYDRGEISALLDEALYCHVAFVDDAQPFAIPTIHVRVDDVLYLHGSPGSRMLRALAKSTSVCVTATLLDGVVLARSVFKHSLNYRSVVVLGRARPVRDAAEKRAALEALVEHVVPSRSLDARGPDERELRATELFGMPIDEASAKTRSGPPRDFESDLELPVWAGVIPLTVIAGTPEADESTPPVIPVPGYVAEYAPSAGQRQRSNGAGA